MVLSYLKVLLIIVLLEGSLSWDLLHLGIKQYTIKHVCIFKNQAYLSINVGDQYGKNSYATLVQVPFPENNVFPRKAKVYPSHDLHQPGKCSTLQNVIATDVDMFGRMWILDSGDESNNCPGKLILYNIYSNEIIRKIEIPNPDLKLSNVLADASVLPWNMRALVSVSNANVLLSCSSRDKKCIQLILKMDSRNETLAGDSVSSTENIAVSKSDDFLFITSPNSLALYSLDLKFIRYEEQMVTNGHKKYGKNMVQVPVQYLGEKLGPSRGLVADAGLGLCYYLSRDFAIVRWDTRKQLNAEGHDIFVQSYQQYPNVSQLISDSYGNIWALVNVEITKHIGNFKNYEGKKNVKKSTESKVVKVVNYNLFL